MGTILSLFNEGNMGHLNGPYYPFCLCRITIFDIPSLMHLRANYLAFNMYFGKQYRLYESLYLLCYHMILK